jgi:hypothetical protein
MPRVTVTADSDPVVLADCIARFLALSDERALYEKRIIAAEIYGYQRGRASMADEFGRGYAQCAADVKAAQHAVYDHLKGAAELERRRWGPGGRKHFADPRPGDYGGAA